MTASAKRPAGRLGKGLSSLMGSAISVAAQPHGVPEARADAGAGQTDPRETPTEQVHTVPTESLHPNPLQPRKRFDAAALEGLAASIRAEGILQPLTARVRPDGGLEIVAGERRWRAASLAGLREVQVLIRPLSDADAARWALIENLQREDLNPIERAEALQALCVTQNLRHAEVGEAVGLSRPAVSNLLRLLQLAPPLRQMVIDGVLQMGHARAVAALVDAELQHRLAQRCVAESWSVRRVEAEVRRALKRQSPELHAEVAAPAQVKAAWLRDLEAQLTRGLETPVHVSPGRRRGTGTVTLEYRSLEDFDRLLERLGVRTG